MTDRWTVILVTQFTRKSLGSFHECLYTVIRSESKVALIALHLQLVQLPLPKTPVLLPPSFYHEPPCFLNAKTCFNILS